MPPKKKTHEVTLALEAGNAAMVDLGKMLGPTGANMRAVKVEYDEATSKHRGEIIPVVVTRLRGPQPPADLQDAADQLPDPQGSGHPVGRGQPADPDRRHAEPGAGARRSPSASCPTSTPTTSTPRSRSSPAPPARWASRSPSKSRSSETRVPSGGPAFFMPCPRRSRSIRPYSRASAADEHPAGGQVVLDPAAGLPGHLDQPQHDLLQLAQVLPGGRGHLVGGAGHRRPPAARPA